MAKKKAESKLNEIKKNKFENMRYLFDAIITSIEAIEMKLVFSTTSYFAFLIYLIGGEQIFGEILIHSIIVALTTVNILLGIYGLNTEKYQYLNSEHILSEDDEKETLYDYYAQHVVDLNSYTNHNEGILRKKVRALKAHLLSLLVLSTFCFYYYLLSN